MVIGRKSLLSRLVSIVAPSHVDSVTELKAWLSPSEPNWMYVPMKGPYALIRCDADEDRLYAHEVFKHFHDAIIEFALRHGPRRGEMCVILDHHHQICLGWEDPNGDGLFGWSGCQFSFSLLAQLDKILDPTIVSMWEAAAKVRNDGWGPQG